MSATGWLEDNQHANRVCSFFLLFIVLHDWHYGFYRAGARTRAVV